MEHGSKVSPINALDICPNGVEFISKGLTQCLSPLENETKLQSDMVDVFPIEELIASSVNTANISSERKEYIKFGTFFCFLTLFVFLFELRYFWSFC